MTEVRAQRSCWTSG